MKLLVIEYCDFVAFPTGGQLAFVRSLLKVFPPEELSLAGICTSPECKEGEWSQRTIDGKVYKYFNVKTVVLSAKRPLIPQRLTSYFQYKKYAENLLQTDFDWIFIQAPEVLFALPDTVLPKVCIDSPGVGNPLAISRYPFARVFANLFDWIYFRKVSKVGRFLATGAKTDIIKMLIRSRGKLKAMDVIQYPTRFDRDVFFPMKMKDCRGKLDIRDNISLFVTVGRLNWFKGWKLMIDAFSLYHSENPDSAFCFIGDGEEQEKILEYISNHNLEKAVILAGKKTPEDIAVYLNAADCFVMASYAEGWSTTLLEACSCGVPCVVTDFGSSEMIVDGKNGYVVTDRDERVFADRMKEAVLMDRRSVVRFDAQYERLSVQHLREDTISILNLKR